MQGLSTSFGLSRARVAPSNVCPKAERARDAVPGSRRTLPILEVADRYGHSDEAGRTFRMMV
jgi:hypothetical protein